MAWGQPWQKASGGKGRDGEVVAGKGKPEPAGKVSTRGIACTAVARRHHVAVILQALQAIVYSKRGKSCWLADA